MGVEDCCKEQDKQHTVNDKGKGIVETVIKHEDNES
jgi:hypothetical protein